jgi:hypothetical protein
MARSKLIRAEVVIFVRKLSSVKYTVDPVENVMVKYQIGLTVTNKKILIRKI